MRIDVSNMQVAKIRSNGRSVLIATNIINHNFRHFVPNGITDDCGRKVVMFVYIHAAILTASEN
jgi:hypothetical protein